MRQITTHHDGHGLNESIRVEAVDEPGPGGASHQYEFVFDSPEDSGVGYSVGAIQFQRGPRNEPDSTPGVTEAAVLAVFIDRIEAFQAGEYACEENGRVLWHLREAMNWMKERVDGRAERGVLGTYEK